MIDDYRVRVKAMKPEQRERALRNFEQLKGSERWEMLEQSMRDALEDMAGVLKQEMEANG